MSSSSQPGITLPDRFVPTIPAWHRPSDGAHNKSYLNVDQPTEFVAIGRHFLETPQRVGDAEGQLARRAVQSGRRLRLIQQFKKQVLKLHVLVLDGRKGQETHVQQRSSAYRRFYWSTDFWFPSLIASLANLSLLLLAFSPASGLAWLSVLTFAGWLFDVLENVNHFRMAGTYPVLSPLSLRMGPLFTLMKWIFALTPMVVALLGLALRLR